MKIFYYISLLFAFVLAACNDKTSTELAQKPFSYDSLLVKTDFPFLGQYETHALYNAYERKHAAKSLLFQYKTLPSHSK
jgi:hypothetical protein